jgi:hypothetical protein
MFTFRHVFTLILFRILVRNMRKSKIAYSSISLKHQRAARCKVCPEETPCTVSPFNFGVNSFLSGIRYSVNAPIELFFLKVYLVYCIIEISCV